VNFSKRCVAVSWLALLALSAAWLGGAVEVNAAVGHSTATLTWTAPGDDSLTGTALAYDMRYSTDLGLLTSNFDGATAATGLPSPQPAGTPESFTVTELASETGFYFAIKAIDDAGNRSAVSNIVYVMTDDQFAPAAVTDLAAGPGAHDGDLDVAWTAVGDDSLVGTATGYIVKYSDSAIDDSNWDQATTVASVPIPQVSGSAEAFTIGGLQPGQEYFVAVKTLDNYGNLSDLSNVAQGEAKVELVVDVDDDEAELPRVFELSQNYPNPFNPSTTIEYSIPAASHVRLTIYNIQGRRIATLVDGTQSQGRYTEEWDGLSDNGARVASGVYFYRLVTENQSDAKKMVLLK